MSRAGFDKFITVFSPQGTLYQVQYAFKAITYSGLLTVSIVYKDGVLVATQHQVPDKLMKPQSITSLYEITPFIGCCMAGRAADGKCVVSQARQLASDYYYQYGLSIPIALLAKRLGDKAQVRTQQAGMRPMGVITTLIGMDENDNGEWIPQIYVVDPAGWVAGFHACAAGKKQAQANAYLQKKQKDAAFNTLSEKEAAMIALSAIQSAIGASLKGTDVEIGRCTTQHKRMQHVPNVEIEEWLTAVAESD